MLLCRDNQTTSCQILVDLMVSDYDAVVPLEKAVVEDAILGNADVMMKSMEIHNGMQRNIG